MRIEISVQAVERTKSPKAADVMHKEVVAIDGGAKTKTGAFFQAILRMSRQRYWMRPRGALGSEVQLAYLVELLCPGIKEITIQTRKLSDSQQAQITSNHSEKSLRELAKQYRVSYETVRRVLKSNE